MALMERAKPLALEAMRGDATNALTVRQHYAALEAIGDLLCEDAPSALEPVTHCSCTFSTRDLPRTSPIGSRRTGTTTVTWGSRCEDRMDPTQLQQWSEAETRFENH